MTTAKRPHLTILRDLVDLAVEDLSEETGNLEGDSASDDAPFDAASVRGALLEGVVRHKADLRARTRQGYEKRLQELAASTATLPADPVEQRQLVLQVFSAKPAVREAMLTVQHREFEMFSDKEVESLLRQLASLGHFDDIGSS